MGGQAAHPAFTAARLTWVTVASRLRAVLAGSAVGLLAVGCASFPEQPTPAGWSSQVQLTPQAGPTPELPGELPQSPGQGQQAPSSVPPPQGCQDFNPAVIGTCLDRVSGVAPIAVDQSTGSVTALASERTTGRLLRVAKDAEAVQVARFEVDASADGGLTAVLPSPTYAEDQLVYAYVTTATDNRVLRIAPGDVPKPVLTGIPKGASGNRGALAHDAGGALLVATGDAGNRALAADPSSLAGKVLRIDPSGGPAQGNPTASSRVFASGLSAPTGLCVSPDGARTWLTDVGAGADALHRVEAGKALGAPAWSWPDRPGLAGCAAAADSVWVGLSNKNGLLVLPTNQDGSFSGEPAPMLDGDSGFGRIGAVVGLSDQAALVGTVNKNPGGTPVSSDDRVAVVVKPEGVGGGKD